MNGSSIERLSLYRLRVPLRSPYKVAFALIEHFDAIVAEVVNREGATGLGEATILTGYTDETIEGSWGAAREFAASLLNLRDEEAMPAVERFGVRFPFAATAFGTALEMVRGSRRLEIDAGGASVPLLGLLHARTAESIEAELQALIDAGYRTVKVKVGFDPAEDARMVKLVQCATRGRVQIRLDANQGYTADEGIQFVKTLDPSDIELFEQPCAAGDWEAHLAVRRASPVPMMLDESIYSVEDIEKAVRLDAAAYIKVKLMKFVTLDALAAAIERIKALGMKPVLGNGVACDLGCWMECCIAARHIENAGEMNGFLKASAPLVVPTLELRHGAVSLKPGFAPRLDDESIRRHLLDSLVCGPGKAIPRADFAR